MNWPGLSVDGDRDRGGRRLGHSRDRPFGNRRVRAIRRSRQPRPPAPQTCCPHGSCDGRGMTVPSIYLWLKALHVAAAFVFVGGLLGTDALLAALREPGTLSGAPGRLAPALRGWNRRVTTPAMLIVVTLGPCKERGSPPPGFSSSSLSLSRSQAYTACCWVDCAGSPPIPNSPYPLGSAPSRCGSSRACSGSPCWRSSSRAPDGARL